MTEFYIGGQALDVPNAFILEVSGWIDLASHSQLEKCALSFITTGKEILVFDLSQLQYISTRGLGSWLTLQKRLEEQGGSIILIGANGRVKQTIEITGVNQVIPMFASLAEARQQYPALKAGS